MAGEHSPFTAILDDGVGVLMEMPANCSRWQADLMRGYEDCCGGDDGSGGGAECRNSAMDASREYARLFELLDAVEPAVAVAPQIRARVACLVDAAAAAADSGLEQHGDPFDGPVIPAGEGRCVAAVPRWRAPSSML